MTGTLIIPLVALRFPIMLLLMVVVLDAMFVVWAGYSLWHDRSHGPLWRLLHRPPHPRA